MATFTWKPQTATKKSKPRVRVATFGDGYSQRAGDGINNNPASWSLTFQQIKTITDPIVAFLDQHAGRQAFDWTPPTGMPGRFICSEWEETVIAADVRQITGTFEQVYGA